MKCQRSNCSSPSEKKYWLSSMPHGNPMHLRRTLRAHPPLVSTSLLKDSKAAICWWSISQYSIIPLGFSLLVRHLSVPHHSSWLQSAGKASLHTPPFPVAALPPTWTLPAAPSSSNTLPKGPNQIFPVIQCSPFPLVYFHFIIFTYFVTFNHLII